MTESNEPGTQTPVTTGARLAAARNALGLSVAEAAAQMRLAPRQVEALETDRYADLPGPVFVRGFLRNYARLLKLDPQPLLAAIEPAASDVAPLRGHLAADEIPFPSRRRARWIPYVAVLAVLVLGAAAIEYWFARRAEPVVEPPAPSAPAPAPAPAAAPAPSSVELSPSPVVVHEGAAGASMPGSAASEPVKAGEGGPVQVLLRFAGESWVEVRDRAGAVLHNRSHRVGEEVKLDAPKGATFVIGNSTVVRMTYNGAPFDLAPHSNVGVARFNLE